MTVNVELKERSYKIIIDEDVEGHISTFIKRNYASRSIFIIVDENVAQNLNEDFIDNISAHSQDARVYKVPQGESSKSISMYSEVLEWLANEGAKRDSLIIAIGGGVIGDLAGFVAASYMRGIDFIQVPTSLLAQVDSSVGGKTAINIAAGKNLVGAFYQPKAVFCGSAVLKSLPEREMRAGYAEIYKYGLLWDEKFMLWLHDNGQSILRHDVGAVQAAVKRCCEIKAEIVSEDEHEAGVRALLNLGHTFGHALESLCKYDDRLKHGEAVSIGMCIAADLSERIGSISSSDYDVIVGHLKEVGLPTYYKDIVNAPDISVDDMMRLMARDKKATASGVTFIVLDKLGKAATDNNVSDDVLREVLERFVQGS